MILLGRRIAADAIKDNFQGMGAIVIPREFVVDFALRVTLAACEGGHLAEMLEAAYPSEERGKRTMSEA